MTIDSHTDPDIAVLDSDSEGDYSTACETGRQKGSNLIAQMRQEQNPTLLGAAIRQMVERGTFGPVEIGFCSIAALTLIE